MREKNEELGEALELIDMESWLDREGVKYKVTRGARGTQLNIKECPCCGNSNWKVYINADSGLGNCFHGDCEEKFNKWKFIKASLGGVSNKDAVEHVKQVAAEMGWRPARREAIPVNMGKDELKIPEAIDLPYKGRNLKYLDNRNITSDVATYFHLKFSKHGKFEFTDVDGHKRFQDYSDRVIIPIFDLKGELVSFQGRDITGTADKKYLFPPGFSSTGSILYNAQNAVGAERIVVGEGVFDVMAIKIALDAEMNLRDVVPVGSFGKHLSAGDQESQLAKLMELKSTGLKQVTFMWDGEDRAIEDAVDAALMVKSIGLVARIALLPKDKDPNEVAPNVVREAFWKAEVVTPAIATRLKMLKSRACV